MKLLDRLLAAGRIPDPLIRMGIRRLLSQKEREEQIADPVASQERIMRHIESLRKEAVAVKTAAANEQHYEVPTAFFKMCLGRNLKYSSGFYPTGKESLDEAEECMLRLTCERARLGPGQSILELGCGWGSLTLWIASTYPDSTVMAVSNSRTQKLHIDAEAARRGLSNVEVITADMNAFTTDRGFDRIVSVEMFEHMKNYETLLQRVSGFLKDDGLLFVHIFTHLLTAYHYEGRDPSDWITRYFFEGGQMPSDHLLLYFQDHLRIEAHWRVNGKHYSRTAEDWLRNMDRNQADILPLFEATYGKAEVRKWWNYWRIFYMSCAELWGWKRGTRWFVSHYLFSKRS